MTPEAERLDALPIWHEEDGLRALAPAKILACIEQLRLEARLIDEVMADLTKENLELKNRLIACQLTRTTLSNDIQELTCGDVHYTELGQEAEQLRLRCAVLASLLYPRKIPRIAVAGDIELQAEDFP